MATSLELVLCESFALQDRRVNSLQREIILGTGEVQKTQAVDVALVLGGNRYLREESVRQLSKVIDNLLCERWT